MKRLVVIAALLAAAFNLSVAAGEPAVSEIDGKWELIAFNNNGKDDDATVREKFVLVRDKGVQTITKGGKLVNKSRFTVDSKSKPKTITFAGEKNEPTTLAIYKLTGSELKVAVVSDDKRNNTERPKDFEPASDKTIATYRKAKGS